MYEPDSSARGSVAVVNGTSLLLTPLRHSLVPPSMSSGRIQLPSVAACLSFRNLGPSEVLPALTACGTLQKPTLSLLVLPLSAAVLPASAI